MLRLACLTLGAVLIAGAPALAQDSRQDGRPASPLAPRPTVGGPTLAPGPDRNAPVPPPTTTPKADEPMEEMVIIAPRRPVPDYQEYDEFLRAEFEKIRARYEKPGAPPERADTAFDDEIMKEPDDRIGVRDQIKSAPRLRDTVRDIPRP